MTLAEARAILPTLKTAPADEAADADALHALARWCDRYTPLMAIDGADGLMMDITGCGHLFGNDQRLMADLSHRLQDAGIETQVAVADSVGAAWALARFSPGSVLPACGTEAALKELPAKALRLDANTLTTLQRLGLKRVGDILALPRPTLARRFRGRPAKDVSDLLMRLDQALGVKAEPVEPLQPLPLWRVRHAFSEPVTHLASIEAVLPALINDMMAILARSNMGARRLCLNAFRVDGSVQEIGIGTSRPTRDGAHLARLFNEKIDTLQSGFGFDLVMLSVTECEKLSPTQITTVKENEAEATAQVLDRLSTRLGAGSVMQLKHRHSHIPERTQSYTPAFTGTLGWDAWPADRAQRPLRLLMQPEALEVMAEVPEGAPRRFRWRRVDHKVTRAEGPERIAAEWWHTLKPDDPDLLSRDYYRIEVTDGARFWVFRRGLYAVPGVRAAEQIDDPLHGDMPRWFMHGFFA